MPDHTGIKDVAGSWNRHRLHRARASLVGSAESPLSRCLPTRTAHSNRYNADEMERMWISATSEVLTPSSTDVGSDFGVAMPILKAAFGQDWRGDTGMFTPRCRTWGGFVPWIRGTTSTAERDQDCDPATFESLPPSQRGWLDAHARKGNSVLWNDAA